MMNRFEMPAVIDALSASMMEKEIASMTITDGTLSFDASRVYFIAGAGLRLMRKLQRSGLTVRVYGANDDVREMFDAADLSNLLAHESRVNRAASLIHGLFSRPAASHAARPAHA